MNVTAATARAYFFSRPTGKEFAVDIQRALKATKQRNRKQNGLAGRSSSAVTTAVAATVGVIKVQGTIPWCANPNLHAVDLDTLG